MCCVLALYLANYTVGLQSVLGVVSIGHLGLGLHSVFEHGSVVSFFSWLTQSLMLVSGQG